MTDLKEITIIRVVTNHVVDISQELVTKTEDKADTRLVVIINLVEDTKIEIKVDTNLEVVTRTEVKVADISLEVDIVKTVVKVDTSQEVDTIQEDLRIFSNADQADLSADLVAADHKDLSNQNNCL